MRIYLAVMASILMLISCKDKKNQSTENPISSSQTIENNIKIYWATGFSKDTIFNYDEQTQQEYAQTQYTKAFADISDAYFEKGFSEKKPLLKSADFQKDTIYLENDRRQEFLLRSSISEEDKIFVYQPQTNIYKEFLVKDTPVMVCLNVFSDSQVEYRNEFSYEFGFDLGRKLVKNEHFVYMVYVGKENPFVQGNIERMVWQPIHRSQIPATNHQEFFKQHNLDIQNCSFKEAYAFKGKKYFFYTQDFIQKVVEPEYGFDQKVRYLTIFDNQTQKLVNQYLFIEGDEIALLNLEDDEIYYQQQFTGELFKGKPAVLLNLIASEIGCPTIYSTDPNELPIVIRCDNRD